MKILFIGDIFGEKGKLAIQKELPKLKKEKKIDLVIANAENTTKCRGLSVNDYNELCSYGVDFFTMGNHTWKQKDYKDLLNKNNIIRPLNINDSIEYGTIGEGTRTINVKNKTIRITNLIGSSIKSKLLESHIINPFKTLDLLLIKKNLKQDIHFVDFHAETTSEKNCFFLYFKSRVQSIVGTHTHVQTNDPIIIDNTSYITDVGMTGPSHGVIGANPISLISMFKGDSEHFVLSEAIGPYQLSAVLIEYDDKTNKPIDIKNILIREIK